LLCIGASFLRLGAIADFLSKPILVGFLNGIGLSIILGQIGKLFGYSIEAGRIVPRLVEFVQKLGLTHLPTLFVGAGTFLVLFVLPRLWRAVPAPLMAMVIAACAVRLLHLEALGVKTVGAVASGLPLPRLPHFSSALLPTIIGDAAGLALVTFSSMMLTSRSFASKNRYDVDVDREFAALGAANIASALSQGFAVSGADSRTAVSDASGGRTQMTGLIAAVAIATILFFLTSSLRYIPNAAIAAVLVKAGVSLLDITSWRTIYNLDRREFALSVVATLGVVAFGAIQAILIAVVLAILRFVRLLSRPKIEVLGGVQGFSGFHAIERHPGAVTTPGLLLLRFNAPLVFFNAPYFRRSIIAAADAAGPGLKWLVLDLLPVTMIDTTGLFTAEEVADTLRERGVVLTGAGRQTEWRLWAESKQRPASDRKIQIYQSLGDVVKEYRNMQACCNSDE
jgi:MFS superfamily sulfate permease-like transporter